MAKSSVQNVKELLIRKLSVKIKGMKLMISPELYAQKLAEDIILIAQCDGDIDQAVQIRVADGAKAVDTLNALQDASKEYKLEIETYKEYLSLCNNRKLRKKDIEVIILKKMNDEPVHLRARIHEMIRQDLSGRFTEAEANSIGFTKENLLFLMAYQIENLAKYESHEDCARVELSEANIPSERYEEFMIRTIKKYSNFEHTVGRQVRAYKTALKLVENGDEMSKILEAVRNALNLN